MKFGKTDAEFAEYNYQWKKKHEEWHRWFAWHPVSLADGRLAWLETVERRVRQFDGGYGPDHAWYYRATT